MDINTWRGISTIIVMIAFIAICWWAFAPRRKKRFDDAANLPFADESQHSRTTESVGEKER
ncbi:cbb3-type cytochrome oxidase subunit 3 [Aurantivibrio plasticivorans]